MTPHVLIISSSAQGSAATSFHLAKEVAARYNGTLKVRDLSQGLFSLDEQWVSANHTAEEDRTEAQRDILQASDALIAELYWADLVVIACPIYNFSVPSALKAWIDLVCRAGLTFQYTENGPEGLLTNKRAILVMTSGGVPVDSAVDFATPYLRQVMSFIGITDTQTVRADQQLTSTDFMDRAKADLDALN